MGPQQLFTGPEPLLVSFPSLLSVSLLISPVLFYQELS